MCADPEQKKSLLGITKSFSAPIWTCATGNGAVCKYELPLALAGFAAVHMSSYVSSF